MTVLDCALDEVCCGAIVITEDILRDSGKHFSVVLEHLILRSESGNAICERKKRLSQYRKMTFFRKTHVIRFHLLNLGIRFDGKKWKMVVYYLPQATLARKKGQKEN